MSIFLSVIILTLVIFVFNGIIFVHELGHFLAAKWRGMRVDRFQIWFGKPLWKKTINGVQYGIGSIPFGGFVSIPDMAPMESIEGEVMPTAQQVKKVIRPLDKIIVAVAGPVFSILLALVCSLVVWKVGRVTSPITTTEIGYVIPGSPAEKAGLRPLDKILEISGERPSSFMGDIKAVSSLIALSEGEQIEILVDRPGQERPLLIESKYGIEQTKWYERKAMRKIGIAPKSKIFVGAILENSPAEKAGLKKGDQITEVNGNAVYNYQTIIDATKNSDAPVRYQYLREGKEKVVTITPLVPDLPEESVKKMIGVRFMADPGITLSYEYPNPLQQLKEASTVMLISLQKVASKTSSIDVQHLSGPIGIGRSMFDMLQLSGGWKHLIWFLVIFNVNLAILNLMPFPVLDGGHIVMALFEWITGKEIKLRVLEFIQVACTIFILSLFIFITSKDIGDMFKPKKVVPSIQFFAKED